MAPVKPQVPTNILQGGSSLGWFTPPSGAPAGNKYDEIIEAGKRAKAAGLNVDLGAAFQLTSLFPQQSWEQEKQKLDYIAQQKREEADYRQKLGEESTQKALLYSAIGNLGKSISSAIAGSPEQQQRLDNAYTNALQATTSIRPSTLVISPGSAIGQRNYFK